jgi:hypothetical protein
LTIINNKLKEIREIENRYGLAPFRMGLSHLVDVGHRNLRESDIEKSIQLIMKQGENDAARGRISVMTPEFQCEILRCAAELARFGIWTLFAYIKKHVAVGDI